MKYIIKDATELRYGSILKLLNVENGEALDIVYKHDMGELLKKEVLGYFDHRLFCRCSLFEYRLMQCMTFYGKKFLGYDLGINAQELNFCNDYKFITNHEGFLPENIASYLLNCRDVYTLDGNLLYVNVKWGIEYSQIIYKITPDFVKLLFLGK